MEIDSKKIIKDTLKSFTTSVSQQKKFAELKDYITIEQYKSLHKEFLTPTSIKIDVNKFLEEIKLYENHFEQWGTEHLHLPRFGLALVNQDGKLKKNDPINGSLHEWNIKNPHDPIIETDCKIATEVLNIESLNPLRIFDGHWCRSNILKWNKGSHFKPHIDTILPSPWLRLWATTTTDKFEIRSDNGSEKLMKFENLEAGRVYVIDTSLVHDATSFDDNVYQLFLSVMPSAFTIIPKLS